MNYIQFERNNIIPEIEYKYGLGNHATHNHVHKQWSIGYVVSGSTDVQVGVFRSSLEAGQYIAIPGLIPHLCHPRKGKSFSFKVLYLPTASLESINRPIFKHGLIGKCLHSEFQDLVDGIVNTKNETDLHGEVDNLTGFIDSKEKLVIDSILNVVPIEKRMATVDNNDEMKTRYQLYYYCRKKFGIGTKNITIIQKIEKAKVLLIGKSNLTEIAQDCDFYDQSHFTKTFKQYTGLTPSQYKLIQ